MTSVDRDGKLIHLSTLSSINLSVIIVSGALWITAFVVYARDGADLRQAMECCDWEDETECAACVCSKISDSLLGLAVLTLLQFIFCLTYHFLRTRIVGYITSANAFAWFVYVCWATHQLSKDDGTVCRGIVPAAEVVFNTVLAIVTLTYILVWWCIYLIAGGGLREEPPQPRLPPPRPRPPLPPAKQAHVGQQHTPTALEMRPMST